MSKPRGQSVPHRIYDRLLTPGHQSDLVVFYFRHGSSNAEIKGTARDRYERSGEGTAACVIAEAGYGKDRNYLDSISDSGQVSSEEKDNHKITRGSTK